MVIVNKTIRIINFINQQMYVVMGLIITFLSIMIFYDIIARYFFKHPTSFGFDTSIWLTGVMAFIGGGYALLRGEHVRVDIYYDKYSQKTKCYINLISNFFIFITVAALVWWGGQQVFTLYTQGTVATSGLNIPMWVKWLIVPLGGILLGLQAIVTMFKDLYFIFKGINYEGDK